MKTLLKNKTLNAKDNQEFLGCWFYFIGLIPITTKLQNTVYVQKLDVNLLSKYFSEGL